MELDDRLRQKVVAYKPSAKALDSIKDATIVLMVGITGAGKDAAMRRLLDIHPDEYDYLLSHITRPPRANEGVLEREGVDYHFINFDQANKMLDAGNYLEVNIVHYRDIYGNTAAEVKRIADAGKIAITDITIDGADDYVALPLNTKPIFLLPPDYATWKQRLLKREGEMQPEYYRHRLLSAQREIRHALTVDYFYIVINDGLQKTAELINDIAHGQAVEKHYPKAMAIAKELLRQVDHELSTLDA